MNRFSRATCWAGKFYRLRRGLISAGAGMALCLASSSQADNVMRVDIRGTVVATPACEIIGNSAGRIEVSFGTALQTTLIDGNNYQMPIPFTLSCSGNPSTLRFQFSGSGSAFEPAVLATNFADLGVRLLKPDNSQLDLGTWFQFDYTGTPPALKAVPVKRSGAILPGGDFGTSATLVVEVL
ncbi:exotoxin [Aeromonas salmonicida]|nr:exotoxin [Aeromonas salmonicida]